MSKLWIFEVLCLKYEKKSFFSNVRIGDSNTMSREKLGLVHVYTGDGKGKSTTAFGMALRGIGQNFKVKIIQFLKGGYYTGEYIAIQNFLNHLIDIEQYGKMCLKENVQVKLGDVYKGFYVRTDDDCGDCRYCFTSDAEEKEFVSRALARAKKVINSGQYDLVFLDEINNCIAKGLISVDEVLEMIATKPENMELILTGRNAPDKIKEVADLVTNMQMEKHPFEKGVFARRGIEF